MVFVPLVDASQLEDGCIRCHVYVDGCFKPRHRKNAGKSTTHECPISGRFADNDAVKQFRAAATDRARTNRTRAERAQECNDFAADRGTSRERNNHDVAGQSLLFSCIRSCVWNQTSPSYYIGSVSK